MKNQNACCTPKRLPGLWSELPSGLDSWVDQFFAPVHRDGQAWLAPGMDIIEDERGFQVTLDLPGFTEQDLQVEFHDGKLSIAGERMGIDPSSTQTVHRRERRFGKFERTVSLPSSVRGEGIEATYRQGVLSIQVPKREEARPQKIEVKMATE